MGWNKRICSLALSLNLVIVTLTGCQTQRRPTMTLSIAASLQDAILDVEVSYQREHGSVDFRNNFGSSGTLAREIEQGAPVDAIISAGTKPVDDLQAKWLLVPGTRMDLLSNSLVLIAPQGSRLSGFDGLASTDVHLIALGDPSSVPAGQYGKQTLVALNLYNKVSRKLVLGKDVRQVLTYVESGNADAGLVYATDAQISQRVRVVAVAPKTMHDPIVYPFALVEGSKNEHDVRSFAAYLSGSDAKAIFAKHGFVIP